jgi:hypothetical protein
MDLSAFNVIAIIAIAFLSLTLFLALFEPGLSYRFDQPPAPPIRTTSCIKRRIGCRS